ncbi:MAG: SDR family oxidoreductase [Hyphomonadaceae bacterium]|nr:SDR family oxidoreductase [Hyphomonadaceae bacterium]
MKSVFRADALAGKTAFVAGGTSGINLGIATRLAQHGAKVTLLGRNELKANDAAQSLRAGGFDAMAVCADVRDYGAVEDALGKAAQRYGQFDIVVSGAAGNFVAPVLGMSANGFRAVVDIDLIGTFNVCRAAFVHLRRPGAVVLNISAGQAVNARPYQAHVSAAKAGVNMLTKALAMEWGPAGVRVLGISPGPVKDTEGMRRLTPTAEAEKALCDTIPLRRYAQARELGDLAVFLSSDAAGYMTGAIVDCDGGSQLGDASADSIPAEFLTHDDDAKT